MIGKDEVKAAVGWWIATSPDNDEFVRLDLPTKLSTIIEAGGAFSGL